VTAQADYVADVVHLLHSAPGESRLGDEMSERDGESCGLATDGRRGGERGGVGRRGSASERLGSAAHALRRWETPAATNVTLETRFTGAPCKFRVSRRGARWTGAAVRLGSRSYSHADVRASGVRRGRGGRAAVRRVRCALSSDARARVHRTHYNSAFGRGRKITPAACGAGVYERAPRAARDLRNGRSPPHRQSVPPSFEAGVGDHQPLAPHGLIVEVDRHLHVTPDAR
jgi:hypothetical protein